MKYDSTRWTWETIRKHTVPNGIRACPPFTMRDRLKSVILPHYKLMDFQNYRLKNVSDI